MRVARGFRQGGPPARGAGTARPAAPATGGGAGERPGPRRGPTPARGSATAASAVALLTLAVSLAGCHAGRALRPLPPGATVAELSFPSAWLEEPSTFPVGSPVLGVRHGLTPTVEGTLRLNAGPLLFGIVGLEAGATWHARRADGWVPGLHLGGALSGLLAPGELGDDPSHALRGAAVVDATAHWEPGGGWAPYVVAQNAVILADGTWVLSVLSGVQLAFRERWSVSAELGWAGLNLESRDYSAGYLDLGSHGALWMGWSVAYRFGAAPPAGGSP